jgi:hypothetical protein
MKKETLEEAAKKFADDCTLVSDAAAYKGFIDGAKWQAERMYNEEDMAESFMACWKANVPEGTECKLSFNEFIEQFKKK